MKFVSFNFYLITILLMPVVTAYAEATSVQKSPIGYWKTIDDVTQKPRSILEISENNGEIIGKVIKVFSQPGDDPKKICKACKGSRHNQSVIGMVVMQGLTHNKSNPVEWSGGEILDPKTGKTYHCSMQLANNGEKLKVRGYLGMPLFGRTQTWVRASG